MKSTFGSKLSLKNLPVLNLVLISLVCFLLVSALVARMAYADTVTIVPDGVVSTGAWSGVSAANLSDGAGGGGGGDATYATITGALDTFTVTMSNDAAYSGATINSVRTYVRASVVGGGGQGELVSFGSTAPVVSTSGNNTLSDDDATPASRTDHFFDLAGISSATDVDNLEISVDTTQIAGGEEARVFEVWVDVTYTPAAAQNEITTCDGCHGQPPVEGASRNVIEGAVVGSHSKHSLYACTVCHPNNVALNHRGAGSGNTGGQIDMLASIQGGTYSGGTAVPQDNDIDGTGLGTCSDISCHGGATTTTPQWGTSGGLGCDGCHDAPPATGAHDAHYSAKGWGATDTSGTYCLNCHTDNSSGHVTDVTDGIVEVLAGLSYSSVTGSCGNAPAGGCHNGAATPASPGWATFAGITCTDCHTVGGVNTGTSANPVSGLHNMTQGGVQKHDDTIAGGCEACHTKSSIGGHWDGSNGGDPPNYSDVQVGVSGGITNGTYTDDGGTATSRGTCATSCHTDGGDWSRQWSTAADSTATTSGSARCDVCHGQYQSIGGGWRAGTSHGETFGGVASGRGSGHNSLGGAGNACEDCHLLVTDGFVGNLYHEDGNITINNAGGLDDTTAPPRVWCSDCHTNDGDYAVTGTHTFQISTFPLDEQSGPNDPSGSCFGCHGGGTAGASQSNYWPDSSNANAENTAGEHVAHMTLLARRVYDEDLTTLLADNVNGASDTKQRALCQYCHQISDADHMNTLPAEVFPNATFAKRFQDGASDTGTLASYDGGASGTCSNVDCHNSKANTPGTYGWYDAGAADCDMCHTPGGHAEDFANPTSGLHNITPTISGTTHDDTLTACATCHSAIPNNYTTQASAHINGFFAANTGLNNDRYLFTDYTDGSPGTCAGGNVGAGSCHDQGDGGTWNRRWDTSAANSDGSECDNCHDQGDGGTWNRRWDTPAANSDGSECDNCHGGVNGEGTWTFGSNNTVGDGSMSHDRNWDGAGTTEVIGQHSADTSATDRCNTCHVYGDAEYGTFTWGAGNHGDNEIDMNSSNGYSRSGGDAYGCTSNCHSTGGSHLTENSGWTLGAIAGPSLGCTSCHAGVEGANDNTEVGASSPHTQGDAAISSATGGAITQCEDCHFTSHGAQGSAIPIPWDSRTMGTDYTDTAEIHIIAYGGATNEAEACWNCHNAYAANVNTEFDEGTADSETSPGPRKEGTLNQMNWFGATWSSANFNYKQGTIASIHQTQHDTATPPGSIDTGLTAADTDTISCTACHDVHQVGSNGYESGAKPYLRGTWTSNPFPEDGAPRDSTNAGSDDFKTFANDATRDNAAGTPNLPRVAAGGGAVNNELGGYQIEQNNGITFNETYGTFGGLCQNCHTEPSLDSVGAGWTGHAGVVSGFAGGTGNNFFRTGQRGGNGTWTHGDMGYASTTADSNARDTGKGWIGGLRNDRQWVDGVQIQVPYANLPGIGSEPTTAGVGLSYAGGAVTSIVVDDGTAQDNFHNFPCSKCHDPHASRLPRLMITNCLDVNHNTWDDGFNPSNWSQGGSLFNATEMAYSSTAQNCHRYVNSGDSRKESGAEGGWNTVTPWTEF